ncbi:Asp-tRNA(Asn)/Glu-tRNA(Gln) amidotransferase subunit GatA, partial [Patescibacteria group bacterium]|nr:Asp-tRNA(Asn)/Glu-tRNA(Gln) amidotransferase subunit GatA [Patescibacteria group bacterium]
MSNLNELTIKEAHKGLVSKKFSSVELTNACLDQIKKVDNSLHAYLEVVEKSALQEAKIADQKISSNDDINILCGVPTAIKDVINVVGQKTTAGSKILENFISPYDATVIEKLKLHQAVFLGKTNPDEFACGSSTENSSFGSSKNPWDIERVPGGSSGGSAVAVSANECIYALGSDTGGSIRQPASLCGMVGLKPTYGRVSRYGLLSMASSLDQIGPMTKTVEDSALVMNAISGVDKNDSTSISKQVPDYTMCLNKDIKGLKIGVPKEYFIKGLDSDVEKIVREAIKKLEELGAKISEVSLPNAKYALPTYYIIMPSELSSNLARYDGVKYGYSAKEKGLMLNYFRSRAEGFGPEIRRRVMLGAYSLSSGYYDAYYLQAQKVRTKIK